MMVLLRCVHRVNFIIFANVWSICVDHSTGSLLKPKLGVGWKNTPYSLKHFEQGISNGYLLYCSISNCCICNVRTRIDWYVCIINGFHFMVNTTIANPVQPGTTFDQELKIILVVVNATKHNCEWSARSIYQIHQNICYANVRLSSIRIFCNVTCRN